MNQISQAPQNEENSEPNETTENVENNTFKEFHLENIFLKRIIACFLDSFMVGAFAAISLLPGLFLLPYKPINILAIYGFFIFAAAAGIILIKDTPFQIGPFDSQTPGKKAMNIKVYDLNKKPITMEMSIKRNIVPAFPFIISAISFLIRVIPFGFITSILGLVLILPLLLLSVIAMAYEVYKIYSGKQHRRWGDEFSGTIVAWE